MHRINIAVIGSGDVTPESKEYQIAMEIGRLIARERAIITCGGLGGVMKAVCQGAFEEKGKDAKTVGILPGENPEEANQFVNIPIPTGIGEARNAIVAAADAVIAIGGGSGTLSEIALAWKKGKLLLGWRGSGWSGELADKLIDARGTGNDFARDDIIIGFDTAQEAINIIKKFLPLNSRK